MGIFSLKKRGSKPQDGSPASFISNSSTVVPSPTLTNIPSLPPPPPKTTTRLRVAIDPLPEREDAENEIFYIDVDPEETVDGIRRAIVAKTGIDSMGVFKARIPWQAQFQMRAYANRYSNPASLMNHFHTWNLDDPTQLIPSGGEIGRPSGSHHRGQLRVMDWFPAGSAASDMVQIIASPCPKVPSSEKPMTFIVHFAPNDPPRATRPTSSSPPQARLLREPVIVHVSPRSTVDELKAAVLEADQRTVGMLDKVVMWRVEMSEQELIVIEERGGLKGGRMPWPYPPTAPVPTALEDGTAPLSDYFDNYHFDGRMVHLTIWIHPSAAVALAPLIAPQAENAPPFKYPMSFSPEEEMQRRVSASHSLPPHSPTVSPPMQEAVTKVKSRRSRPSTAPAIVVSPSGSPADGVPAFGAGSTFGRTTAGSKNGSARGRLARLGPSPLSTKGLGILEADADRTPELDFSNLNLSVEYVQTAPVTPIGVPEWNPSEYGLSVDPFCSKSKSLGVGAMRKTGRIPDYA